MLFKKTLLMPTAAFVSLLVSQSAFAFEEAYLQIRLLGYRTDSLTKKVTTPAQTFEFKDSKQVFLSGSLSSFTLSAIFNNLAIRLEPGEAFDQGTISLGYNGGPFEAGLKLASYSLGLDKKSKIRTPGDTLSNATLEVGPYGIFHVPVGPSKLEIKADARYVASGIQYLHDAQNNETEDGRKYSTAGYLAGLGVDVLTNISPKIGLVNGVGLLYLNYDTKTADGAEKTKASSFSILVNIVGLRLRF
jgi:hypothetical protein